LKTRVHKANVFVYGHITFQTVCHSKRSN